MDQFFVYVIFSETRNRFYVGSCEDLTKRVDDHNSGRSTYTKSGKPWELMYSEQFGTRSEAVIRERSIKNKKSRKYIEYLINSVG